MRTLIVASWLMAAVVAQSQPADLAARLSASDPAVRAAAVLAADQMDAAAIVRTGALLDHADPLVATAAVRALQARAGRVTAPDAEAQRAAVEAAFLELAAPAAGRSPRARAEAMHLLAVVATGEAAAQSLTGWLDDPEPVAADAAEFALARIANAATRQALRRLLAVDKGLATERAARLLAAQPDDLTPEELRLVTARNRDRVAAAGSPRVEGELRSALASGAPGALACWLEHLHARGAVDGPGREFAVRELGQLLGAREAATRRAALSGVIELAPDNLEDILLDRLSDADPKVAGLAATEMLGCARRRSELALRLRGVLPGAVPPVRAGLLRILFDLDPEHTLPPVLLAAGADEPIARNTALELLGRSDEPAALAALRGSSQQAGTAWQGTALRSLLTTAARRARAGQRASALELCHEVLRSTNAVELRVAALVELRGVADESSLAQLTPLAAVPELREDVAQVQLALARRLPGTRQDQAIAVLKSAHDLSSSPGTRRQILVQMSKLGADVSGYAARNGCVQEWRILGPCGKCDGPALGEQPFGQNGPDLDQPFETEGRKLAWQKHRTTDPCGVVDLRFLEPNENVSAYALVDLDWPRDEALQLKVGSDDGVAVWVNGERVHLNNAARPIEVDDDTAPCRFRAGRNRVLVKISQGGGGWGFCLRVTDQKGEGVDLSRGR